MHLWRTRPNDHEETESTAGHSGRGGTALNSLHDWVCSVDVCGRRPSIATRDCRVPHSLRSNGWDLMAVHWPVQHDSTRKLKWRALGDDFRTFLSEFVVSVPVTIQGIVCAARELRVKVASRFGDAPLPQLTLGVRSGNWSPGSELVPVAARRPFPSDSASSQSQTLDWRKYSGSSVLSLDTKFKLAFGCWEVRQVVCRHPRV